MRLAVLGGSSVSTVQLAKAIVDWPGGVRRRPDLELRLHGRTKDKLNLVAARCATELASTRVSVTSSVDLDRVLAGADVVLVQVRVGGLAARAFDESYARAAGLPGEETLGPGGFANAARTVRALDPIWPVVRASAPGALVVILTNPAGIVRAAAASFGLNAVEVCDAPVGLLNRIAARHAGAGPDVHAYLGMNHVGWWLPASEQDLVDAVDLSDVAGRVVLAHGALPLSYLRYFVHQDLILAQQDGAATRAEQLMELEERALEALRRGLPPDASSRPTPWYDLALMPLLDAWENGSQADLVVGLANEARLPGLDPDVTLEAAVGVQSKGFVTRAVPRLPELPMALLQSNAVYETLALTAAREPSAETYFRALLANPMVATAGQAARAVDALLAAEDVAQGAPAR
jgi:6-phospho-beta-glucosidase